MPTFSRVSKEFGFGNLNESVGIGTAVESAALKRIIIGDAVMPDTLVSTDIVESVYVIVEYS